MAGYETNMVDGWLNTEDNYGIYSENNAKDWWIASPWSEAHVGTAAISGVMKVDSEKGSLGWSDRMESESVRPIVCMTTARFNLKYKLDSSK